MYDLEEKLYQAMDSSDAIAMQTSFGTNFQDNLTHFTKESSRNSNTINEGVTNSHQVSIQIEDESTIHLLT